MYITYHCEGIAIPRAYKETIEHLVPIRAQGSAKNHEGSRSFVPWRYSSLLGLLHRSSSTYIQNSQRWWNPTVCVQIPIIPQQSNMIIAATTTLNMVLVLILRLR